MLYLKSQNSSLDEPQFVLARKKVFDAKGEKIHVA